MLRGKKLSEEHKRKISLANKGKIMSKESREKMSLTRVQMYKSGYVHPRKGKKNSEESKQKRRDFWKQKIKSGYVSPLIGRILTDDEKKIISERTKEAMKNLEIRKKISLSKKGKYHTEEWKQKISEKMKGSNNPFYGKHLSEEHKKKLSLANKGKRHTEEWKQKMTELLIQLYKNGHKMPDESRKRIGLFHKNKIVSEETKQKIRNARLKQIFPIKDTIPECLLQQELTKEKIVFIKHKTIEEFCQCDIFIEPNIVIFVDGCYWHGCEQCFDKNKFTGIQRRQLFRDNLVNQFLLNKNYVVLRFWEHDIKKNVEIIKLQIINKMDSLVKV